MAPPSADDRGPAHELPLPNCVNYNITHIIKFLLKEKNNRPSGPIGTFSGFGVLTSKLIVDVK